MQHERLIRLRLHQPCQIRLLDRRIDMRILVVLEHPKIPIKPHINTARLNHARIIRIDLDPPGFDLGPDITIGEQHARTLPGREPSRIAPRIR
jgi:hypothetical protein